MINNAVSDDQELREKRGQWWMCLVYFETLEKYKDEFSIDKFVENLRSLERVRGVILSPLHDLDCDENGELKKAHWHILLYCVKDTTASMLERLNAVTENVLFDCPANNHFEWVKSAESQVRYSCHLDENYKHKYSPSEVQFFDDARKFRRYLHDSYYDASMFNDDFWGFVIPELKNKRQFWISLGQRSPEFQKFVSSHSYYVNIMLSSYFEKKD